MKEHREQDIRLGDFTLYDRKPSSASTNPSARAYPYSFMKKAHKPGGPKASPGSVKMKTLRQSSRRLHNTTCPVVTGDAREIHHALVESHFVNFTARQEASCLTPLPTQQPPTVLSHPRAPPPVHPARSPPPPQPHRPPQDCGT
ncbi:biotin carboxyl carrier protein of acetyl-CoA carboxylase, chloroplastic-like [Penaeus japonicus]|uniref:biotin carboxyl carrier protein of acetyl-CoA carboxylase, chloroplastic-like n=1 Tax=Penaeus japonicus TaxID=27405 RepID=UPI001C70F16E|nr:biotin carboxyl carrier protein of acetyl-CoA carboxylase, chloroplastic-like [Penaeus japonicus]